MNLFYRDPILARLERMIDEPWRANPMLCDYTGPAIEDYIVQNGIAAVHTGTTNIRINSTEPTTYAIAVTSGCLGYKSFGANNTFGADTSASPSGRLVTSAAISDGTITTSGTASWWAATDETNSRLLAHGSLSATQAVTSGNSFSLAAFTIKIPAAISG
jgi:hypothetical protein